ncbi:lipopolysaccharide biosynthesis protein [Methanocella sp. MCL-LM]|uniref:lipopolysaccharide biosynthesis protein n=1 Tax=Methanocella sp. MCL-LM TaxID=3412035 RepID=UPI003C729799
MPGLTSFFRDPLYRNSLFIMLNTGLVSLFNYLLWLLAGKVTSAENVGLTTAGISAAAMMVAISRLGMDDSITRFFPQSKDRGGFLNALIAIMLAVTIVVTAGFMIGLPYISPALLFLREWQYALLFVMLIFLTAVTNMQGTALVAIRRADLAFVEYSLLFLRIPLLFLAGSLGVLGILLALDITYLVMLVVGVIFLYRMGVTRNLRADFGQARKTMKYSLSNYVALILYTAPYTLIPILVVNVLGATAQAYYYAGYSIAAFLLLVPDAIVASMFVEGAHERPLKDTALRSLRFALAILVPMVVVAAVFGDNLLRLFSPEHSAAAYQLLMLLAISSLFYAVIEVYFTVMQVRKNLVMLNFVRLSVTALTLGLGYVLLQKLGLIGIGYAWLLACVVVSVFSGWMMLSKKTWQ